MKKTSIFRYLGVLTTLLFSSMNVLAGGDEAIYESKLTVSAEGAGKVYVSETEQTPSSSAYQKESSLKISNSESEQHTYYIYVDNEGEEGEIAWYKADGTTLDLGVQNSGNDYYTYSLTPNLQVPGEEPVATSLIMKILPSLTVNGIKYLIKDNDGVKTATVDVQNPATVPVNLVIPDAITYHGTQVPVTKIAAAAFANCTRIESVVLPASLTELATTTENIVALPGVDADEDLAYTFAGCTGLKTVDMSVCTLSATGAAMFAGCSALEEVNLGNASLTQVSRYSFYGARSLTSAIVGENVTLIGMYAFSGCVSLQRLNYRESDYNAIVFPPALQTLGSYAFGSVGVENMNDNFKRIYFPAGFQKIGMYSLYDYPSSATKGDVDIYCYNPTVFEDGGNSFCNFVANNINATLHLLGNANMEGYKNLAQTYNMHIETQSYNLPAGWSTICILEESEQPEGVDIYQISHTVMQNGARMLALERVTGNMQPGVPYICYAAEAGEYEFVHPYGAEVADAAGTNGALIGVLANIEDALPANCYVFDENGELVQSTSCAANGAYIDASLLGASQTATAGYKLITLISVEDNLYKGYPYFRFENNDPNSGNVYITSAAQAMQFAAKLPALASLITSIKSASASSAVRGEYPPYSEINQVKQIAGFPARGYLYDGDVDIPETIVVRDGSNCKEYNVVGIDAMAFAGQYNITSITLPASLRDLQTSHLQLSINGETITTDTGSGYFYKCYNLKTVTFAEGFDTESLGAGCFFGCHNLVEIVNMPQSLREISDAMFVGCYKLGSKNQYISENLDLSQQTQLERIGKQAFAVTGIPSGEDLYQTTVETGKMVNFQYYFLGETMADMDAKMDVENWNTEFVNHGLREVVIPETVTTIDDGAFLNSLVYQVTTPDNRSNDGQTAYSDLSNVTTIGKAAFERTSMSSVNLMNVTVIPNNLFYMNRELRSVVMSNGVTSIGANAFEGCSVLASIDIDGKDEEALTLNLPDALQTVGESAFRGAGLHEEGKKMGFRKIVLPKNLTNIGSHAFNGLTIDLVVSDCDAVPTLGENVFNEYVEDVDDEIVPDDESAPVLFLNKGKRSDYVEAWDNHFYIVEKHTRSVNTKNYGTICLPYNAKIPAGMTIESLTGITLGRNDMGAIIMTDYELADVSESEGMIKAGVPYLFTTSKANLSFELADEIGFATQPGVDNGLCGTLHEAHPFGNNTAGIYMLKNNQFWRIAANNTCPVFRAYIDLNQEIEDRSVMYAGAPKSHIQIMIDAEDATAILGIGAADDEKDAVVYDLNGRQLKNAGKGVYIVNGKKVLK